MDDPTRGERIAGEKARAIGCCADDNCRHRLCAYHTGWADGFDEAADEIERLQAALEPFAVAWRTAQADPYYPLETVVAQDITTDQWRTAAEALDE